MKWLHDGHPRSLASRFFFVAGIVCVVKIVWEYQAVLHTANYLFSLIVPFVCGFIVAYILNLPCSWLQKRFSKKPGSFLYKRRRLFSILLTYLLLLLLVVLVLRLIIPALTQSVAAFTKNFSTYYKNAQALFDVVNSWGLLPVELSMDAALNALKRYGIENISQHLAVSLGAISSVFSTLFTVFLALVSSIYILVEKDRFKAFACRFLRALSKPAIAQAIIKYCGNLNRYFRQYIYCQTIDGCILGTLATIELFFIGSPYFLLLGIMLGIVNYIPYFGSIIGSLVAVAVVGFTQSLQMALVTAAVLLCTQQIDGNFIQPRLMGGSFALSPLLIIVSITIGGTVGGPLGMIAAIPIVAVLKEMLDDLLHYLERRNLPAAPAEVTEGEL